MSRPGSARNGVEQRGSRGRSEPVLPTFSLGCRWSKAREIEDRFDGNPWWGSTVWQRSNSLINEVHRINGAGIRRLLRNVRCWPNVKEAWWIAYVCLDNTGNQVWSRCWWDRRWTYTEDANNKAASHHLLLLYLLVSELSTSAGWAMLDTTRFTLLTSKGVRGAAKPVQTERHGHVLLRGTSLCASAVLPECVDCAAVQRCAAAQATTSVVPTYSQCSGAASSRSRKGGIDPPLSKDTTTARALKPFDFSQSSFGQIPWKFEAASFTGGSSRRFWGRPTWRSDPSQGTPKIKSSSNLDHYFLGSGPKSRTKIKI